MKKRALLHAFAAMLLLPGLAMAVPTIYPKGTTIYDPAKAWNGFTVLTMLDLYGAEGVGTYVIDMNGNKIVEWEGLMSFPGKVFPGGMAMGFDKYRAPSQDAKNLQLRDFNNKVVWEFNDWQKGEDGDNWSRQHHDVQVSGNPVGYYSPGLTPDPTKGKILVLAHTEVEKPAFAPDFTILDDVIYEVDVATKKVLWQWKISDSFDQLGLDDVAKKSLAKNPTFKPAAGSGDWAHINSASYVGPNKWYEQDPVKYAAFHPENIIWDAREMNIIGITDRNGKVVWKVGPYYNGEHPERKLGWIVGQHHAHMIPKGLPGAGNIMVYDNGGWGGYGQPNAVAPQGVGVVRRDWSRVLEFDPVTLDVVWQYGGPKTFDRPTDFGRFYSPYISSAQRLENGNTLITEGSFGRIFEVTPAGEIVWEHLGPSAPGKMMPVTQVYRAYRMPYDWLPQVTKPVEKAVVPAPETDYRVPTTRLGK